MRWREGCFCENWSGHGVIFMVVLQQTQGRAHCINHSSLISGASPSLIPFQIKKIGWHDKYHATALFLSCRHYFLAMSCASSMFDKYGWIFCTYGYLYGCVRTCGSSRVFLIIVDKIRELSQIENIFNVCCL